MDASNHARAAEAALQQGDDETLALAIAALRTEIDG
jgi:hypothetical protein